MFIGEDDDKWNCILKWSLNVFSSPLVFEQSFLKYDIGLPNCIISQNYHSEDFVTYGNVVVNTSVLYSGYVGFDSRNRLPWLRFFVVS